MMWHPQLVSHEVRLNKIRHKGTKYKKGRGGDGGGAEIEEATPDNERA